MRRGRGEGIKVKLVEVYKKGRRERRRGGRKTGAV